MPTSSRHKKSHPAVSYHVKNPASGEMVFKTFEEAAAYAVIIATTHGEANLDVCVFSAAGAKFYGGDDAVEFYNDDPQRSVHERLEISVNMVGGVA